MNQYQLLLSLFLHVNRELTTFQRKTIKLVMEDYKDAAKLNTAIVSMTNHTTLLMQSDWVPKQAGSEAVQRPDHYGRYPIEPTYFIMECEKAGYPIPWPVANFLKYICRFPFKNGIEDIRKSCRYLTIYMGYLDGQEDYSL